ncbi:hypothetical protein M0P48_00740 [Candidatus Gracilibacteria bacterium]|nr:hypothetical protein [Candidatus Gracilibacteria bacterium]
MAESEDIKGLDEHSEIVAPADAVSSDKQPTDLTAEDDLKAEQASRINDSKQADQIRESLGLGGGINLKNLFKYSDPETGYRVANVEVNELNSAETERRYETLSIIEKNSEIDKTGFFLRTSTLINMDIVDSNGQIVGHFKRIIHFTKNGIFVEHDDAKMEISGTGFGSRFEEAMEEKYRNNGIKAIIRGCGLSVGRYEGAKNGFDFLSEDQRLKFIDAFCNFLKEKGRKSVTFNEENFSVEDLAKKIRTPQDILAVEASEVEAGIVEREWSEEKRDWMIKGKRVEKFPAGKAFFLDQESQAKKSLDNGFYSGKWMGIKRLV